MTRFFDIIMLHLCIYVTHVGVVMLYNRLADLAKVRDNVLVVIVTAD